MPFTVIYDACVLFSAPQRDLLIRLARTEVFRARWTDRILDECFRALSAHRPDLAESKLERTRVLMNIAVEDACVTGFEGLADHVDLPDPDDRHVLAAALRCGAQTIVTANLRDFPARVLGPLGLEALHPDQFVLDLLDLAPGPVLQAVSRQAASLRNPPRVLSELLDTLENNGLVQSTAEMRRLLGI